MQSSSEGWLSGGGRGIARALALLGVVAVLSVIALAACNDDDKEKTPAAGHSPTADAGIDYGSLSGDIRIDGSSTVYPISEAVAEEFGSTASGVRVNVAFSGSGAGFEKFCRGETEISDASRPIKDEELQACADNQIDDVLEFQVAIDALTVMVNPNNDFVDCLTVQQLHDLFKTDGASKWSDIDPSWPDEDIVFYYPGTDSGTFDYFLEAIIEGVEEGATHRGDGTASEDDNVLALGIEGDDNAIGYFGFAYYQEAGQALKAVAVDSGGGCVEPTFEAALDGSYSPLSRPLFIYTRESFLSDKPEVLGLVNFYLDSTPTLVPEVGYVTMPDDLLQQQLDKLAPFLP
jgi:phosphate transport system substrate-binding protein